MTGGRAAKVLVGLAVSAALLALVLRSLSPRDLLRQLGQTHWGWLALSALLGVGMVAARGIRWRWLFHPARPAAWPLVSATAVGYMANNLLPLRMGELARASLAARGAATSSWTALATLAVERVLDALSILLILAGVVLLVEVPLWLKSGALTLLAVDLAAMAALILLGRGWGPLARLVARLPRAGVTLGRWLALFSAGLASLRPGPHLAPLLAWTVAVWALNVAAIWAALLAAGLHLPPSASLTVLAFAGIGVALPSAPGYVGTFQFFVVQALALFSVEGAPAVGFSFLVHAAAFVPQTVLGWGCLAAQGLSLREVTTGPEGAGARRSAG